MDNSKQKIAGELSLCWGSMEGIAFQEFLSVASTSGFKAVTINPTQYAEAHDEGFGDKDIAQLLADKGLVVSDIDPLFNWLPCSEVLEGDDVISRCTQVSAEEVFHIAHVFGTDLVNAPLGLAIPDSEQQIIDCFGELCEKAGREKLRVCLEFMPFTQVSNLEMALRIVNQAGCDNGGIMFDCWHHHRAGGKPSDLLNIPGDKVFAMQLDDAMAQPMEDILEETLNHRMLPGEGCIELLETLRNLKSIGAEVAYDVEVFKDELRSLTPQQRAKILFDTAEKTRSQISEQS